MYARQLSVHEGIFGVVVECGFEQLTSFVHFAQFYECASDALVEVVVGEFGSGNLFEKWARVGRPFFEQQLAGEQPVKKQRTAMGELT